MTVTTVTVDHGALGRLVTSPGMTAYVRQLAGEVAVVAAAGAPHRSGRLAASITVAPIPGPAAAFAIGSGLVYSGIVERRTPYLRPALTEVIGGAG